MRTTRPAVALVAAAALSLGAAACGGADTGTATGQRDAASPTDTATGDGQTDGQTAPGLGEAASWITGQFDDDGAVPGFDTPQDVGATIDALLALAAAGVGADTFDAGLDYVRAEAEGFVNDGSDDQAGPLGKVVLLADAAGDDPRAFGDASTDLIARIEGLLRAEGDDAGMFHPDDQEPNLFGQATGQALAMLGLSAADAEVDDAAVDWLVAQQCPDGGFAPYVVVDDRGACAAAESAPDTNTTAVAVQALVAAGAAEAVDAAVDWLRSQQLADGGFGFAAGAAESDPNSTALVVQALVAAGEDPDQWTAADGDATPLDALRSFQFGCDAPESERGAFRFPGVEGPSALATYQAAWGLAERAFPFGAQPPADATTEASDCPPTDAAAPAHGTASALAARYAE